jgi:hypothetical protein
MDSTITLLLVIGAIVLILLMLLFSAIRVVQQYERGVIFVLGRLIGAKGPGIFLVPPFISRMPLPSFYCSNIISSSISSCKGIWSLPIKGMRGFSWRAASTARR